MALAVAGTTAAAAAAALYIDGKYHIKKDLEYILGRRRIEKGIAQAVKKNRASLYYLFEEAALANTDRECIWSRAGCYSWTESYQLIHKYAQFFLSKNVQPGDLVAFYLQNKPEFLFAWIALWEIGAAPAMINYNLGGEALIHCMGIGKAREGTYIMLVDDDEALRARIEDVREALENKIGAEIVILDDQFRSEVSRLEAKRVPDEVRNTVRINWPLALFYTSGTTGMPKGCPIILAGGHAGGISRKAGVSLIGDDDRWYNCMPLYHGTGGMASTSSLMSGTTLCLGKKFSVTNFWSEIRDSKATWFSYVGETARYLLAAPPSPLDKQHNVKGMYGNGLRPDVWSRFQERFGVEAVAEFFNSTEGMFALINYARSPYLRDCVGHHGLIRRIQFHSTYVPVEIDSDGNIARDPKTNFAIRKPYSEGGEMIVKIDSEAAFAGYHKNPGATAKMFVRDVFKKGDLYYRTGDALRRDEEGRWFFLDRLGDTFRWKGENVSTAEVAHVLGTWKGVVEANVYGVTIPGHDGRAGCAAIFVDGGREVAENGGFDFRGLLRHARSSLPKYAVPIFIRVVKEATPTHNNKQNKVPLRKEGVDPDLVDSGDVIYWVRPGGDTYEPFRREDWEGLKGGRARL